MKSETRPYTIAQAYAFSFDSALMGARYDISVALPASYTTSGRRYPVLVVVDGDQLFELAVRIARNFAMAGEVEELIVVGVACPAAEGFHEFVRRRHYEFSPPGRYTFDNPLIRLLKDRMERAGFDPQAVGGAPEFLRFLADELLPTLAGEYRLDMQQSGLFGHSAGGAFVLYALLSGASPFRKYICGSPATSVCDGELFRIEERYAAAHRDLEATLYMAAGAQEMQSAFLESGGIVSGLARFAGLFALRRYPSLRVASDIFPGEGHTSVMPVLLGRGLRMLWGTGRGPDDDVVPTGG